MAIQSNVYRGLGYLDLAEQSVKEGRYVDQGHVYQEVPDKRKPAKEYMPILFVEPVHDLAVAEAELKAVRIEQASKQAAKPKTKMDDLIINIGKLDLRGLRI